MWAAQLIRGIYLWVSPSVDSSGASGSPPVLSEASSLSTCHAEGPGYCGSAVFIAEQVGVGETGSGDTKTVDVQKHFFGQLPELGLFSSTAKVSGFPEYQLLN
jgi:hypothetical protein